MVPMVLVQYKPGMGCFTVNRINHKQLRIRSLVTAPRKTHFHPTIPLIIITINK